MAAFMELEDEEEFVQDDYYTLLNVDKKASKEEITSAYRRLSKVFHPDKHINPVQKKNAEDMFNKVKKAYEVLTDPNKRQIYDNFGVKGLEIQGLEVVTRTKSPAEIIEELNRYKEEQEKRRLEQRTNPKGNVTVKIGTEIFDNYDGDNTLRDNLRSVEIQAISISQSVECPLTKNETVTIAADLCNRNGRGQGTISILNRTTRWMNNKGWTELDFSFGNGAGLAYGVGGKIFRNINKRCYCMIGFGSYSHLLVPVCSLTYQLSKHLMFRVTCCPLGIDYGVPVFFRTNLMYSTEKSYTSFGLQLGVQNTFISASYTRRFVEEESKLKVAVKCGSNGAMIECECEKRITKFSWLGATMSVGVPLGVILKIKLVRGQQVFLMPIHLSEEVMPAPVLYGTVVPILVYSALKKFVVDPYLKKEQEQNIERKKEEMSERLAEKKKQAETAISLMKETVERIIDNEEKRKGLIVVKALYGKLSSNDSDLPGYLCLDVTIPLQALVKDSKLILHDRKSMSEMPGFYDPCPGEEKSLYIRYLFREKLHQVTLDDNESVRIPVSKHVIDDDVDSTNFNT